jgi:hypothetical protein
MKRKGKTFCYALSSEVEIIDHDLVAKVKYWSLPIQQVKQQGGHTDWVNLMKVKDESLPISVN